MKTLSLLGALFLATPAFATVNSDFHWAGTVERGRTVEIRNINGAIHAEPSKDGTLEVTAIRSSRKYDPASVKIEVFEVDGKLTFCSLYPSKAGSPPNTCDERGNTSHSSSSSDVEVSYRIRVPAGVTLEARTVNGDVVARNLEGPVDARTVNGEIKVATASWAQATTVNGSVAVAMAGRGWPDDLDFRTVNGDIVLDFADAPNADLRAETLHGDIDSDFPLKSVGKIRRNRVRATLGSGGPELALATLNGSIELRRTAR
jgi:hypothetical protein